jgi:hypothetical protein
LVPVSVRLLVILTVRLLLKPQLLMRSKSPLIPVREVKLAPEVPTVTVPPRGAEPEREVVLLPVNGNVAIPVVQLLDPLEKAALLKTQ